MIRFSANRRYRYYHRPLDRMLRLGGLIRAQFPVIRATWEGARAGESSKRHAVLVHYDRYGQIHGYFIKMLQGLNDAGFLVTVVSNAPRLGAQAVAVLKPHCRKIIHRFNSGYDFAAYRDGIRSIGDLSGLDALILMNDSVYGPLLPLDRIIAKADAADVDFWGITDSWEQRYHLQGYFLLFFSKALNSRRFERFWRWYPNVNNKRWVITYGEVQLTRQLLRDQLRVGVLCPYWEVAEKLLESIRRMLIEQADTLSAPQRRFLESLEERIVLGTLSNPSHYFWETLIRDWDCPFLKRELITSNPMRIALQWRWRSVIKEVSDYDPDLIEDHLRRL